MADNLVINDLDKFIKYKYSISEFYILINGETRNYPLKNITGFKIENYYEGAMFPIFKLNVVMSDTDYYEIINNKDNVKFKLRIQSYYTENDSTIKSMTRDTINDLFVFFPEDSNDDYEKDYNDITESNKEVEELDGVDTEVELFLFQDSIVNGMRSSFNAVINNSDLCSAVSYLLSKAGAKNVLMSPFDNTDVYSEIIIPPQSIEKSIKYLNNNYGFHKSGTLVYFGLSNSYVISCDGNCTAWQNNEPTETIIYILDKKTNTKSLTPGVIKKHNDTRNYINAPSDNIDIRSSSAAANVINGVDAQIIDIENGGSDVVSINTTTVGNTNKVIIFNESSNKYMKDVYASLQQSNSITIDIALSDIDINAFTPNKSFSIIFENIGLNTKYKGNYRICSSVFSFAGNHDAFAVNAAITLKKVK